MGYFDQCLYYSANQLARKMNSMAEEAFRKIDLTPTQGFTLILIGEKMINSPSQIAAELNMKPSTITRFLDTLEKLNYVRREYIGRKTIVSITNRGNAKIEEIHQCWQEIQDSYSEELGEPVSRVLTKAIINANQLLTKSY
jgi:DNA-binding MarR family transcriptional regulator